MSHHDAKLASPQNSSSPLSAALASPMAEDGSNNKNTAEEDSLDQSQSAKRSRGRPRKYHTDAEREDAKRRYRENHKTKAATGGDISATTAALTPTRAAPKQQQQDVVELWEVVRGLQEEIALLKMQLAQRDAAAAAAALPGQKRARKA
jgi:hypothetical protein